MKALTLIMMSALLTTFAHANTPFKAMKCSNSDGTVTWEYGLNEDLINLKYSHFIEGTLTLNLDQVEIKLAQEILVKEKRIRECTFAALSKVFASKVVIRPADKNPYVLQSLFPENKIETEVICTLQMHTPRPCPTQN